MVQPTESALARSAGQAEDLAAQALDNLVNQFARPLDFLRELVQNAIDAGSPRATIWFRFRPPAEAGQAGVLEIHVDDQGEGMDEAVIDNELTRMFSSSKEDDLTKIGKFGIGFTSIFAIRPDAVLLRTGRHGENWELLFHPDRSFDKVRIDEPVDGTKITLFKGMAAGDVTRFVARCRWTVKYWLEHSNAPVLFGEPDLDCVPGRDAAPAVALSDDPFAAFADPSAPAGHAPGCKALEQLNGPLELDAELTEAVRHEDIEGLVGYADVPLHAFYNGGLTLVRSSGGESLGTYAPVLAHLAFKLKSPHLEHTLTRDNVLQDQAWGEAMDAVTAVLPALRDRLLVRIEEVTHPGGDPGPWLQHLVRDCLGSRAHERISRFADRLVLPLADGSPVTYAAVLSQEEALGCVLLRSHHDALDRTLLADGIVVLDDLPAVRGLLHATFDPGWMPWSAEVRSLQTSNAIYALPELLEDAALGGDERRLVSRAREFLRPVLKKRVVLRVGDFGGSDVGLDSPLLVEGPEGGGVFRRSTGSWMPNFLRRRCLIVNRHHPAFRSQVVSGHEHLDVAAYALAAMLLSEEDAEGEGTFRKLLDGAVSSLEGVS